VGGHRGGCQERGEKVESSANFLAAYCARHFPRRGSSAAGYAWEKRAESADPSLAMGNLPWSVSICPFNVGRTGDKLLDLAPFLTSAVVAALVAGFVALRSSERKIQIENITQERAKWREKIRSSSLLVHHAATARDNTKLAELNLVFSLLLNPHDTEDKAILASVSNLQNVQDPERRLVEFSGRVSYLLKHDWERAKHEAKPWPFRWCTPSRPEYK
jgi:hypothetical protein